MYYTLTKDANLRNHPHKSFHTDFLKILWNCDQLGTIVDDFRSSKLFYSSRKVQSKKITSEKNPKI